MRGHGTITRWNEDRGFGLIAPAGSETELFVHVSAFPRGGARPSVGELVSFEIEQGQDGRERAVRIFRAGQQRPLRTAKGSPVHRGGASRLARGALALLALIAAGWALVVWEGADPSAPRSPNVPRPELARPAPEVFQCDGRMHCSQMSNCAEATFFIRNCPDTRMDGDRDGIPCESQHCPG